MTKNIFFILNHKDKHCIHILNLKYGNLDIRANPIQLRLLGLSKCEVNSTSIVKSNLWINVYDHGLVNILKDPWIFDTPLVVKPTYIIGNTL